MNEKIIVTILLFFLFLVLTWLLYYKNISFQFGDTTFAGQILSNFRHGNFLITNTFGDSIGYSMENIWYRPASYVCKQPLISTPYHGPWGHYYFIMFALIPLTFLFDIFLLVPALHAFIYTSIIFFVYFFSRERKLNIINSFLLTILITQHPLWELGLFGQFYFNRLFIPLCAFIIFLLSRKKSNYILLFVATILALSTNEIYGIVLFFVFTAFALLFHKKEKSKLIFLTIVSLLYSLIAIIIIQHTVGGGTQVGFIKHTFSLNLFSTINNLVKNSLSQKTLIFLMVNIGFLGILSFTNLITGLTALIFLLPNIFVSIGGAEKTGWATHYHSGYFIPLIWLSIMGISMLKSKSKYLISAIIIMVIIFSMFVNYDALSINKIPSIKLYSLVKTIYSTYQTKKSIIDYRNKLRSAVGQGTSISAPEAIAYNLMDHKIYYYPMNIDFVDKVIFRYDPEKKDINRFYSINYGQQDDHLDECIIARMKKDGFDFTNPKVIGGWAVIGRKQ
ncbi:MAG: DUF2079 domain-containing protein [Cyanobacteria bacterium]|nr:DUF2079 domain-containing protein [Cyanobacteriota bacterium]